MQTFSALQNGEEIKPKYIKFVSSIIIKKRMKMFVSFSDLPGTKNLMLDFIYEFENVEKYGLKNFREPDVIARHIYEAAENDLPHRAKLVEILKKQYENYNASQLTKKNINSLLSNKTLAVVAAQQIGLFGGPLQYFYKIITAIKLARKFSEVFDEFRFVPVFWLESEDHDYENASKTYTYNYDKAIRKIIYDDGLPVEENRGSVGSLVFGKNLKKTYVALRETLRKTEHTGELLELLNGAYSEGVSFGAAFRRLLFELFDEYGLIIFDANCREAKSLVKDLFKEGVENHEALAVLGVQRSARLEKEYHAQVKIHPVNLYLAFDDARLRIEPYGESFKAGNRRKIWSKGELLDLIDDMPEKFSPDVIFRPLMQDKILPTAVTVAGFNEMNYFPQIIPYYEYFGMQTPLIYPRASVTLNEKYLQKKIDNYGINYEAVYALDENDLASKIVNEKSGFSVDKIFAEAASDIDLTMESLISKLEEIDAKLKDSAEEVSEGITKLLEILREKALKSDYAREQSLLRHVKTLKNQFLPNGKLQEDVINFTYFANHYGVDFIKRLYGEISVSSFEHQIITI